MDLLKLTATMAGEPAVDHPRPERLLRGNPRRETWNVVEQAIAGATVYGGVWRCEPGHWRIEMGPAEHELFTVLQGRCRVHADAGGGAGRGDRDPAGLQGRLRGARDADEDLHDRRRRLKRLKRGDRRAGGQCCATRGRAGATACG